jgi:hypothetical protein
MRAGQLEGDVLPEEVADQERLANASPTVDGDELRAGGVQQVMWLNLLRLFLSAPRRLISRSDELHSRRAPPDAIDRQRSALERRVALS